MQKKKSPEQDVEIQAENHDPDVSRDVKNSIDETDVNPRVKTVLKKKSKKTAREDVPDETSVAETGTQLQQTGEAEKPSMFEETKVSRNHLYLMIGAIGGGILVGFLLCYFLLLMPVQNQLASFFIANTSGNTSSNQMKSDLSTTKLKQQEMEIRYQAVSDQLESANQYIFLLRMKEQIAVARLMVEQKEGLKARQSLSEIQNRFDHLKPFVMKKDVAAAEKLDGLIKDSIQHLVSDPESVKSDLSAISDHLNIIETTLFQQK